MSSGRVLIVEDCMAAAEAMRGLLAWDGYEVRISNSGAEALTSLLEERPDVILLDWTLPDGEGPDVISGIRSLCSSPCLMLTGRDETGVREQALAAGCDDFLAKPFRARELLSRVARLAGQGPRAGEERPEPRGSPA